MDSITEYKIIKSKRKNYRILVDDSANLIIHAPIWATKNEIQEVIEKHHNWIISKKNIAEDKKNRFKPKSIIDGELFQFVGKNYPLKIVEGTKFALKFDKEQFNFNIYFKEYWKEIFKKWYKLNGRKILIERVQFYSTKHGFKVKDIKISNAQKRWGSCSGDGNLNFSWRLVMAPIDVIDCVVVHELAHIIFKDHSKNFWNKVESILPEYNNADIWLNKNGFLLNL